MGLGIEASHWKAMFDRHATIINISLASESPRNIYFCGMGFDTDRTEQDVGYYRPFLLYGDGFGLSFAIFVVVWYR